MQGRPLGRHAPSRVHALLVLDLEVALALDHKQLDAIKLACVSAATGGSRLARARRRGQGWWAARTVVGCHHQRRAAVLVDVIHVLRRPNLQHLLDQLPERVREPACCGHHQARVPLLVLAAVCDATMPQAPPQRVQLLLLDRCEVLVSRVASARLLFGRHPATTRAPRLASLSFGVEAAGFQAHSVHPPHHHARPTPRGVAVKAAPFCVSRVIDR
eukprot:scaffold31898_cov60-Phaeocystis_antarctica.AAC.2